MRPIFAIFNFLRGLKTTKFLEVPDGTIDKMYGQDSSGNLVKDDVPSAGSGVAVFTDLSDVPQSYTDQAGKMLVVNEDENALEFTDVPSGGSLPDGTDGQTLRNNSGTWESTNSIQVNSGVYINDANGIYLTGSTLSTTGQIVLSQNYTRVGDGTMNKKLFLVGSTIKMDHLTASKIVGTNSNKELISLSYGTTSGTIAEGNHTHSLIALSGGSVVKMLTADDTRESNVTLAAVSDFTQALLASSKYRIVAKLTVHQAGGDADFKMQLTAPSGSSITGCYKIWNDGVNTQVTNNLYNDLTAVKNIEMDAYSDSAGYYYIEIEGVIETSTTAGNITFSFAQLNSNAEITTLKKYSIIELTKI